jgi:type II secretion system protein H
MRSTAGRVLLRNRRGFTLLEVLVVVVIIGAVLALAVPPLQAVSQRTELSSGAQQLIGDLRLARTEAIRRNTSVFVARTGSSTYQIQYVGARTLPGEVRFNSGPDTVRFAAFGPVVTGTSTYALRRGTRTMNVVLTAAGHAAAQ